jgi:hypothetical protein
MSGETFAPLRYTLGLGLFVLLSISVVWRLVGFSPMVSDVREYATWSNYLIGAAGGWHLPGYPLLIAATRQLTIHLVPDLPLMIAVCLVAWTLGLATMARILERVAPDFIPFGVLVYGLFPLVGMTLVAYPLSDATAHTLFLAAFYATQRNWKWMFVAATAIGLIVHMVLWVPLFMMATIWLIQRRLTLWHVLLAGLPLASYYILFAVLSGDMFWFFRQHYQINFRSAGGFPLFNAITETLRTGSASGLVKALLVLSVMVVAISLAWFAWKQHDWLMLTTVVPVLLFAATVNAHEAFIVVRYASVMVIPFCAWAVTNVHRRELLTSPRCAWATSGVLVVSQWVWATYIVKYFGGR